MTDLVEGGLKIGEPHNWRWIDLGRLSSRHEALHRRRWIDVEVEGLENGVFHWQRRRGDGQRWIDRAGMKPWHEGTLAVKTLKDGPAAWPGKSGCIWSDERHQC